jgi:hypothetical protein
MKPHRHTEPTPTSLRREQAEALADVADKPGGSAGAGSTPRRKRPKVEPTTEQIKALAEKIAKERPPLVTAEDHRDHKRLTRRGETTDHPISAHFHRGPMIPPPDANLKRRKRPS